MNIENKRIVLTGAASGIGKALLHELAGKWAHIVAVDVNAAALHDAAQSVSTPNARIYTYVTDLTQPENNDALFTYAESTLGGIDIFIANAGMAYYEKIQGADWQRMEYLYRLNVFAPIYAAFKMRVSHPTQPYLVVMTASAMAYCGIPGYALYSSTKAALDRFADAYRYELPDNGSLMLVYPIATRTNFFNASIQAASKQAPVPFPSQPSEVVAAAILRGIERDSRSVHPSWIFNATQILWRLLPFTKTFYQSNENRAFQRWLHG